jgi:hypothetical protein
MFNFCIIIIYSTIYLILQSINIQTIYNEQTIHPNYRFSAYDYSLQ